MSRCRTRVCPVQQINDVLVNERKWRNRLVELNNALEDRLMVHDPVTQVLAQIEPVMDDLACNGLSGRESGWDKGKDGFE